MKKLITLLTVCSLSVLSQAWADVKLPKGSFTTDRLEEALKTAREQKKPVAYLYTNTATTCPLASGASEGFLEAVGRRCVLVYLPVKQGKYYPKLVLTDTDGGRAQCFTYEAYKADSKKTSREIKKQIIALSKKEG